MKYFHSHGGNNKPYFNHRIKVSDFTEEMYNWCENYPDQDRPFRRWHVEWDHENTKGYYIAQFEWQEAAIQFALRWSC